MKIKKILFAFFALLTLIPLFSLITVNPLVGSTPEVNSCVHTETSFRCVKFIKNYDGDTLTVNIPSLHPLFGQKMNVRIKGIDTAELKTQNKCELEKARNAKKLIFSLLNNAKRIDLVGVEREKYFRILANVEVDGKDLGQLLLKNHLAYSYDGGTKWKGSWCQDGVADQNSQRTPAQKKSPKLP